MRLMEIGISEKDSVLIAILLKFVPANLGLLLNIGNNVKFATRIVELAKERMPIYVLDKDYIYLKENNNSSNIIFLEKGVEPSGNFIFDSVFLYAEGCIEDEYIFKENINKAFQATSDNAIICGIGYKNPYFPYIKEYILNAVEVNNCLLYKADDIWCILKSKNKKLMSSLKESTIDFVSPEYRKYILEAKGVSPMDVIYAYRMLLNRLPENDNVIASHLCAPSLEALIKTFKNSEEYKKRENKFQ